MNRAATIIFKLIWTGLAVWAAWSVAVAKAPETPVWVIVATDAVLAVAWATVLLQPGAVRGALYAIAWGWIVFAMGIALLSGIGPFAGPDWLMPVILGIPVAIWIFVLRKRVSLWWPIRIYLALVVLCLLSLPGLVMGVITTIGLGKLIIEMIGRRNVLARSRLTAGRTVAPPRGIVEYKGYEN